MPNPFSTKNNPLRKDFFAPISDTQSDPSKLTVKSNPLATKKSPAPVKPAPKPSPVSPSPVKKEPEIIPVPDPTKTDIPVRPETAIRPRGNGATGRMDYSDPRFPNGKRIPIDPITGEDIPGATATGPDGSRLIDPRQDQGPAPVVAQTPEEIAEQARKAAQAEADALNRFYDSEVAEQRIVNEGRSRGTASVNTLAGLAGSDEANIKTTATDERNKQQITAINAERQAAIQQVFAKIRTNAVAEARLQREEVRLDAETARKNRLARQEEAMDHIQLFAQSGATFEGLRSEDQESFNYLAEQVGGEGVLKAMMTLNIPQDQILDTKMLNGSYVVSYQNPVTGEIRIETEDLGVPTGYNTVRDLGGQIMFIPDNFDPFDPQAPQPYFVSKTPTPKSTSTSQGKLIKSGSLEYSQSDYGNDLTALQATRGTDDYVNTGEFNTLFEAWQKEGGTRKDFLKYFPPKDFVNPDDPSLHKYLKDNLPKKSSSDELGEIADQLFKQ